MAYSLTVDELKTWGNTVAFNAALVDRQEWRKQTFDRMPVIDEVDFDSLEMLTQTVAEMARVVRHTVFYKTGNELVVIYPTRNHFLIELMENTH